jgi:hypothetical protein
MPRSLDWTLPKSGVLGIPKNKRLLLLRKNWSSSKSNLTTKLAFKIQGVNCLVDDNLPNLTQLMDENQLWRIKDTYRNADGYGELGLLKKVAKRQRRAHQRARITCRKSPQINET